MGLDDLLHVIVPMAAAAGVYAAVRSDIAGLRVLLELTRADLIDSRERLLEHMLNHK